VNAPVPDPALSGPPEPVDPNAGIGWYEFITPTATTGIAYVHENGDVYVPEGGWGPTEPFHLAASRRNVHRLIRADVLDGPELEELVIETLASAGDRSWALSDGPKLARRIRTSILGTDQ
jgi:hypothetical protein